MKDYKLKSLLIKCKLVFLLFLKEEMSRIELANNIIQIFDEYESNINIPEIKLLYSIIDITIEEVTEEEAINKVKEASKLCDKILFDKYKVRG